MYYLIPFLIISFLIYDSSGSKIKNKFILSLAKKTDNYSIGIINIIRENSVRELRPKIEKLAIIAFPVTMFLSPLISVNGFFQSTILSACTIGLIWFGSKSFFYSPSWQFISILFLYISVVIITLLIGENQLINNYLAHFRSIVYLKEELNISNIGLFIILNLLLIVFLILLHSLSRFVNYLSIVTGKIIVKLIYFVNNEQPLKGLNIIYKIILILYSYFFLTKG
jgi:hypothetical protein